MTWSLRTMVISHQRSSSYVARAYATARSSSGATTLPTWWSGSPRVLRANTSYSTASPLTRLYLVKLCTSNREAPRFESVAPVLRHAGDGPGRIPYDVEAHFLAACLMTQPLPYVIDDG